MGGVHQSVKRETVNNLHRENTVRRENLYRPKRDQVVINLDQDMM